jgi:RHS repeat-associated protein
VNLAAEQADTAVKWTTLAWTQDDISLSYQKNPRVSETNVYDASGNRRRTGFEYYASFGLLHVITEYAADGTSGLRFTVLGYKMDSQYIDRRIIGLPYERILFDGSWNMVGRQIFHYDWTDHLEGLPGGAAATQHDASNYGTGFYWRGNLVMIARYDATDAYNETKRIENKWGYNITGSLTFTRDPRWHQNFISYTDSFSADGTNITTLPFATFAYPTTLTDGDGNSSYMRYHYDFAAATRVTTPSPNGGQAAPYRTLIYDSVGRLQKITNSINGAYTRSVYPTSQTKVQQYTAILDGTTEGSLNEAYSFQVFDGAGRVRGTSLDFPPTSGRYSGQYFIYNNMGRLVQQSNPIEMDGNWIPAGVDDTAWLYTVQTYDWKGRPLQTTNTDGTTRENTYGGCGCAGGEVVTARDEAGRRRRMTMDVVGRLWKVEELKYDQTVYSTTTYSYNVRDQIVTINHAGQTRSFEYDGHARLWHKTTPEQGTTTYLYWDDDTLQSITDARGAKASHDYSGRHLPVSTTYDLTGVIPGQNVTATANVSYNYNPAGDRVSMTDGLGSASYSYDQLSRMTSETRTFTGLGTFNINYGYNMGSQLTSVTNHWGSQVSYVYDKIGRVTSMTGAGTVSVPTYISNISYRAFGAAKQVSYGNTRALSLTYNNRMFLTQWNIPGVLGYTYHYDNYGENNTGRVTFADNVTNGAARDGTLDRSWYYDDMARLQVSYTGSEARATIGTDTWGHPDGPYAQRYDHDVWGNTTHREGWGGIYGGGVNDNPTYAGNRQDGLTYDLAGNYTASGAMTYDATGQLSASSATLSHAYEGDRLRGKRIENGTATYYLRSSVLGGQVVAELNSAGTWLRGYVYLGGQMLAIQYNSAVTWVHQEPFSKGQRFTDSAGNSTGTIVEVDPWGGNTSRSVNSAFQPHLYTSYDRDSDGGDEAMNRRYIATSTRFSQPDPYDGSYSLTDPQSFNRYAYVNNDPVNFVDPTGLDTCYPDPVTGEEVCIPDIDGGTVTITDNWDDMSDYLPNWTSNSDHFLRIEPLLESPIPLLEFPQEPSKPSFEKPTDRRTECQRFADMVQGIANNASSRRDFLDTLARTFTAANNSSIGEMRRTANIGLPAGRPTFQDGGFQRQFQDGSNQVRHFVGGFIAGASIGWFPARTVMNSREQAGVDDADIALNGVSTNLGASTIARGIGFIRNNIANQIRRQLCQ